MCNYIAELLKASIRMKSSLLQILLLWLASMMSHKARCPTEGLFKLGTSKNAASIKSFISTAGFFFTVGPNDHEPLSSCLFYKM